ncbi:MAG: signal peptidase II [Pseudomonadota bacterium]
MSTPEKQQTREPGRNGLLDRLGSRLFQLGLSLAPVVILLDQLSKWVILKNFDMVAPRAIPVFPGFNLVLVFNKGVSFGQMDWLGPWALSALALAISAVLVLWLRKAETRLLAMALGMIIGGAIGNVIDRLRFRAVVDFLDVYIPGTDWPHWPAFNVADSAIVVGVGLIILDGLFAERAKSA